MIIKCKMCGGDILFNPEDISKRCVLCGSINTVSRGPEDKPDPDRQAAREARLKTYKTVGSTVTFGRYKQDNNLGNGKEDIEWIVLDVRGDRALLISKYGLNAKPYNEKMADTAWENCSLRKWLNNEFLKEAFSPDELGAILLTEVDNSQAQGYSGWSTAGGNNTRDKLFLLSWHEAFVLYFTSDRARTCKATAYAEAQGASVDGSSGGSCWWLRSPGDYQNRAASVNTDGSRDSDIVGRTNDAVRPALWIDLTDLMPLKKEKKEAEPAADDGNGKAMNKTVLEQLKTLGSTVTFGRYVQDKNRSSGKEKIEWIVLDVRGDRALLISKYGLDVKPYNEKRTEITWETCSLRKWLNNEFLKEAFSADEQGAILLTEVDNSKSQGYSGWSTNGGNNTQDKLFLLSDHEAFDLYFKSDSARTCRATAYAKAHGVYHNGKDGVWWWLRSPGRRQKHADGVFTDGSRSYTYLSAFDLAVRPALWIDLTNLSFF